MSRASSPSTARCDGTARVCQLWDIPRSTVYARRARASRPAPPAARRGPKQGWTDEALTEQIRWEPASVGKRGGQLRYSDLAIETALTLGRLKTSQAL